MSRTTSNLRNPRFHVLSIALLAALGASGMVQAQVEAPRNTAEEEATESRNEAVAAAEHAAAAAASAEVSAGVADAIEDLPAPTVSGAVAANANAAVAADAALQAREAAERAGQAADAARSASTATRDGLNPVGTAVEARAGTEALAVEAFMPQGYRRQAERPPPYRWLNVGARVRSKPSRASILARSRHPPPECTCRFCRALPP